MRVSFIATLVISLVAAQTYPAKAAPTEIKNKPNANTIDVLARQVSSLEDTYSADNILNGKNNTAIPAELKNIALAVQVVQSVAPAYNQALASLKGLDRDDVVEKELAHAYSGVTKDHAKEINTAFDLLKAEMARDPHYASNVKVILEKTDPFFGGNVADNTGAVLKEMLKTDPASAQAIFSGVSAIQSEFGILKPETYAKFNKIYSGARR
ncbi:hypothetical protein DSO57_1035295 [Entomophthora muscae]|uniref:Uncharacterized protein n=1 Tax=Entomophthora muscae TaxID=34485 RepID=A0ACC2SNZ8_9FUNG|nr:hypothetical protein DSO57_1035295 [Entomophthora muscae]